MTNQVTQPASSNSVQQVPPYYYEDEISLIDLWLVLVRRKKLIISIFSVVVVLGLVFAFVTPKKYGYSTSIEIGSRIIKDSVQPIESPQTLLAKIQESYVPYVQHQYRENNEEDKGIYGITARVPKGSQLIILESKGVETSGVIYKDLQQHVVNEVQNDHKRIIEVIRKELEIARNEAVNKLEELKDHANLLLAREKRLGDIAKLVTKQIEEAKQDLAAAENSRKRSIKEATNEAKAMTLLMLDSGIKNQRERVANLEERLIVEIAEDQDNLLKQMSGNKRQQQNQLAKIARVDAQLNNLVETRALLSPMQSMEPIGLAKRVILAIAMVLGFIFAIMAAFISEFLQKARQQMAQDQSPSSNSTK
jgi:hypothetical protein